MELSDHQMNILKLRYALPHENSWEEVIDRVAGHVAKAEPNGEILEWQEKFKNIMIDMDFLPGGRILYGAGRKLGAMLNCFALNVDDNRYSIAKFMADMYLISTSGGGVGYTISNIRPKGSAIQDVEGMAPGAVSEIRKIDAIGEQVKAGGSRRTALLAALDISHPDIPEFLEVKLDRNELNNHNISVFITNEFIKAVKKDKEWQFEFNNVKYGEPIKARELWNQLIENSIKSGEPGLLFIDNIKDNFATSYFESFAAVNPCAEEVLPDRGNCCLGSINLSNMYDKDKNDVDWTKLAKTIRIAVRFLDDVLTMNVFPIPETKTVAEENRRVGMGVMGLHYLLIKLGLKYGKNKSIEFIERLFATIRNEAYEASIELAAEKPMFPKFDYDQYTSNRYIANLPPRLIRKMKKNGIRNSVLLTVPPTGTTSQLANVSSGVEPIFAPVFQRRYRSDNDEIKTEILVDSLLVDFYENGKSLHNFVSAYDVSPEEHIAVQAAAQQYIDGAISKSINMAKDYDNYEELSDVVFSYVKHLKGLTIYRQNSRGQEPLTEIKFRDKKELGELIKKAANIVVAESNCGPGECEI